MSFSFAWAQQSSPARPHHALHSLLLVQGRATLSPVIPGRHAKSMPYERRLFPQRLRREWHARSAATGVAIPVARSVNEGKSSNASTARASQNSPRPSLASLIQGRATRRDPEMQEGMPRACPTKDGCFTVGKSVARSLRRGNLLCGWHSRRMRSFVPGRRRSVANSPASQYDHRRRGACDWSCSRSDAACLPIAHIRR